MPNWCDNLINITGDEQHIQKLKHQLGDGTYILNKITPIPEKLLAKNLENDDKQKQQNIKNYGYPTWYEYTLAHWGTQWDVDLEYLTNTNTEIEAAFLSAWSPPVEALTTLSEQHPECTIKLTANETGNDFHYEITIKNGKNLHQLETEAWQYCQTCQTAKLDTTWYIAQPHEMYCTPCLIENQQKILVNPAKIVLINKNKKELQTIHKQYNNTPWHTILTTGQLAKLLGLTLIHKETTDQQTTALHQLAGNIHTTPHPGGIEITLLTTAGGEANIGAQTIINQHPNLIGYVTTNQKTQTVTPHTKNPKTQQQDGLGRH